MNMIEKLLLAVVTEDLVYMCEKPSLLPNNYFGGWPGRCTSDTMHLMVHKIKAAWRHHNVAAVLFLDVEGAFPNAVTACLLHNLHARQIPEEYVLFIDRMLMG